MKSFIERIGVAMLRHFEDPARWKTANALTHNSESRTVQACLYEVAAALGASYIETEEARRSLTQHCRTLRYGYDLPSFNNAKGTTIEMVRILIGAMITHADQPAPKGSATPYPVPAVLHTPLPPGAGNVDEKYKADLLPATPEVPYKPPYDPQRTR